MALLIPNDDLATLPAVVTPIPTEILTGIWQFVLAPAQPSATLPNDFGFVNVFGIDGEHILVLQDSGDAYRLDLFAGGGSQQVGVLEWSGTPTMLVEVDSDAGSISVTVLSGAVTFGGGWTSSDATSATKSLTPWTWSGTELNVGGFFGLFEFDGTIEDVADENGAGPVYADGEGTAAGTSAASGVLSARASLSGAASGSSVVTGALSARASLTGSAAGTSEASATLGAIASVAGTAAGTSSASGTITDANAVVVEVPPERTYIVGPLDLTYRIDRDDRTYRVGRAA